MFARLSALFVTGFISFSAFSQDYYGALEGQFSVSPTGAATYSIPIEVPPGINGMQPNLSLVYNSQAGNGMLGVGWSLAGLSQITRCPATLEQDGFIDPVDFDDNDRFCLDGQRLIAVNGAYGADGTEYRTEIETFQKVVSQGQFGSGPEKFVVWTRTGEIVEFGFNSDSRLVNKEMNDALKWALSRITDNANNQLTIEYFTDYEKLFPLNAKYNFVNNAHSNLVEFGYESRSDYEDNGNGFLQIERYRLKNIRTFTGNNLVSNYNIFYNLVPDNTNTPYASKIEKIKHCSDILENQCHIPLDLSWSSEEVSLSNYMSGPPLSDTASWSLPQYYSTINYPDINGDGIPDICARGSAGIHCWKGNGSEFNYLDTGPYWSDAADWNKEIYYSTIQYPDIDGDGMADICGRGAAGIYCHLANGNGFDSAEINGPAWSNAASWSLPQYYSTIQYPDINGDGKADICGRGGAGIFCHLADGNGFESTLTLGPGWSDAADWNKEIYYSTIQYPDINGDGMADICGRGAAGIF
ncbi:MAG: FG-GAP-like repeat-containing protein, partial [Gammaproteobacteria bacterium]|nr:FG-GAP-like repeat-containing protein [Gammaproteobacteria bacterium]